MSAAKPPSRVRRLTDTFREPAEIRTRLVAVADASAAIVVPSPVRQTFEPSVSGVVVTTYRVLAFRLTTISRDALAVRAELIAVWTVAIEPEVSLIVVTVSPLCCTNAALGTTYDGVMTPSSVATAGRTAASMARGSHASN